jgi:hypothetical protein
MPPRGPLAHLLRNRFYIGDVPFKGEILKGEQPVSLPKTPSILTRGHRRIGTSSPHDLRSAPLMARKLVPGSSPRSSVVPQIRLVSQPDLTGESSMTDREAARSLPAIGARFASGFAAPNYTMDFEM